MRSIFCCRNRPIKAQLHRRHGLRGMRFDVDLSAMNETDAIVEVVLVDLIGPVVAVLAIMVIGSAVVWAVSRLRR